MDVATKQELLTVVQRLSPLDTRLVIQYARTLQETRLDDAGLAYLEFLTKDGASPAEIARAARAVHDTNVWLGAILWRVAAYQVRLRAELGEYTAVTSHAILHELMRVLHAYFNMPDEDAFSWWLTLTELCKIVAVTSQLNVVERDSDDNKFIECAVDGQCHYIVSKDRDLLDLINYQNIRIIPVNEFLRILGEPV